MNTYTHMLEYNNNSKRLINKTEHIRATRTVQTKQISERKNVFVQLLTFLHSKNISNRTDRKIQDIDVKIRLA